MALSTQVYREEAIALVRQGLSLRQAEQALTAKHGRKVVSYLTIRAWVQAQDAACRIQHTAAN